MFSKKFQAGDEDKSNLKLKAKQSLEKFSLISHLTGFKIDTNPGLAKSPFEQPSPEE